MALCNFKKNRTPFVKSFLWLITVALFCAAIILSSCSGWVMSSRQWVIQTIKNNYYIDIDDDILNNCDYKNLTGTVLDKYSAYYSKSSYKSLVATNSGSRSGLGISVSYINNKEDGSQYSIGSGILLTRVLGNSPAYKSGLRKGMLVKGAISESGEETYFTSSAAFNSYVNSKDTNEQFTLICYGDETKQITVSKQDYTQSYCFMSTNSAAWDCNYYDGKLKIEEAAEGDVISYLPDGFAYLSLSSFYGNASNEMAYLIEKFNSLGCTSLILDLRNNGGGYVDVMLNLSYLLTANYNDGSSYIGMYAQYKNGNKVYSNMSKWAEDKYTLKKDTTVYVLANNSSASASEALIGNLISYNVIDYQNIYLSDFSDDYLQYSQSAGEEVKNKRTYGKGIMQTTFVNSRTGEALKLTTATIYWPNGTCIHDKGVTEADGCKVVSAMWDATYADEELQLAVADMTK